MENKCFKNKTETAVRDSVAGWLYQHPNLRQLPSAPNCVVNPSSEGVPIISGGGSGHEPSHLGYVAQGMLTASVAGEPFASPGVEDIKDTVLTVCDDDKGGGCLMIVKSYTGDRLNFTRAKDICEATFKKKVEIVFVADDCAVGLDKGITGRRGVVSTESPESVEAHSASLSRRIQRVILSHPFFRRRQGPSSCTSAAARLRSREAA